MWNLGYVYGFEWDGPARLSEARKLVQQAYPSYTVHWTIRGYKLVEWTNDRKWIRELNGMDKGLFS